MFLQDCSFPAYFYTQPMATGPGFYDNLCPQSWQDGSAATWTLQDPHQQSKLLFIVIFMFSKPEPLFSSLRLPGQLNVLTYPMLLSTCCWMRIWRYEWIWRAIDSFGHRLNLYIFRCLFLQLKN